MTRLSLALALVAILLVVGLSKGSSLDSREVVQASKILVKIERSEPVEYDGVIIEGDLDLDELDLPTEHVERTEDEIELGLSEELKLVASPINITNSEIRGNVSFENAIFQERIIFRWNNFISANADFLGGQFVCDADFRVAQFDGNANFLGSQFNGTTNFLGSQFGGDADFSGAHFGGNIHFDEAQFSGPTYFWDAQFSGPATFEYAKFNGIAIFGGAQFSGPATFEYARFSDIADFGVTGFNGPANFGGAQFVNDYVNFLGSQFAGDAYFWDAEFVDDAYFRGSVHGGADFVGAQFSGDAKFEDATFGGTIDFRDSRFDHANLTLEDAENIYILRLSDTTFENESTICLNRTDFERMYVRWDQIEGALVYNGEAYLTLVTNFKNIEYFEDADDCYYQYRREKQSRRSWSEGAKYLDILAFVSCGYGVRAGYTLVLGLFVVVLCAIYYWQTDAIRRLKEGDEVNASIWDAFYFSMMTFTTVGYGDWYPLDKHRKVVMIEGIVGWLTLSLFLVTLANVIIR